MDLVYDKGTSSSHGSVYLRESHDSHGESSRERSVRELFTLLKNAAPILKTSGTRRK